VAIAEPVDQVPLVWRSKPPIYLTYGAVASLAGLEPYAVIAALSAALLALAALGFWLLAREVLGAGPWGAALAMGLVGLNRMALHTGMHPYFNQTWGYVAMPFAILLGWYCVHHRSWRALVLFAAFLGVIAFAYPLAVPIPLLAVTVFWAVHRRDRGLPFLPWHRLRDRRLLWFTPLVVLLAIPIGGVLEKIDTAKRVLLPGRSLINWGGDLTQFFPERFFLGVDDGGLAVLVFPLIAVGLWIALRRAPRDARWGLGAVLGFGLAAALYFRPREAGYYFHFKALAYVGPIAVAIAAVGLSRLSRRWMAIAAAVVLVTAARNSAAHEVGQTFDQLPKSLLELKQVDAALPPGRSVRLDMTADGRQLWAGYMLSGQPLCSQRPLMNTSYPHVPISRGADYVLVDEDLIKPFDAVGPPVMTLDRYVLYRLRPGLPGGDRCSREMVQTVEKVR
jgi:MFS family permease